MEFVSLIPKTYSYLTNDNHENKKKGTKKYVIKQKLKFALSVNDDKIIQSINSIETCTY